MWAWSHSLVQWTWSRLRSAYIYMQEQYFICAYTGSHDRAYVWYEYMRKSNSAYVCIDLQKWPLLCVHKHARSIALLPAYKCIHNQAYVCIYVRASLHLSVHIHAGMVPPMCANMLCIYMQAWSRLCVHPCAGPIAYMSAIRATTIVRMCASMRGW